jgi:hypothetical protein
MMKINPPAEIFCPFRITDGGQSVDVHYFRGRIEGVCEQSASEEY